jgi:hypothetical protein
VDAWPEPGVQAVSSVDDHSRNFIFFHAASLSSSMQPTKLC